MDRGLTGLMPDSAPVFQTAEILKYPPIGSLSLRECMDRGLTGLIPDSAPVFQTAEILKYPPIGSLSLRERAGVRGF